MISHGPGGEGGYPVPGSKHKARAVHFLHISSLEPKLPTQVVIGSPVGGAASAGSLGLVPSRGTRIRRPDRRERRQCQCLFFTYGSSAGIGSKTYFAVTRECVMAWTERAMRFCTPTLRISFAT